MLRIELIFVVFSHDIGVARLNKRCSGYAALTLPTLPVSSASSSTRLLFDNLVLAFPASTESREGEKRGAESGTEGRQERN